MDSNHKMPVMQSFDVSVVNLDEPPYGSRSKFLLAFMGKWVF